MEKIRGSLWSIRMRASRGERGKRRVPGRGAAEVKEIHVSGAEGLYDFSEIQRIVKGYIRRATDHPRGMPDTIVLTVEKVRKDPLVIPLLPVSTVGCESPDAAGKVVHRLLSDSGISKKAIGKGVVVVTGKEAIRGACLIRSGSGMRAEPDRLRGIRVSRLGIEKASGKKLSKRLSREGINTSTVKEAVVLASKVASCDGVIAELCISDDPHYTTGYVASAGLGYVRIPNIKHPGSLSGGRIFFLDERADVGRVIDYLEKRPVIACLPERYHGSR